MDFATNFAQLDFIRVNEITPSFSFKLDDLWPRREELWELLALRNSKRIALMKLRSAQKASLDQMFSPTSTLAAAHRQRLCVAQPEAFTRKITLASQQLLDRFIFCLMLETQRLVEYNKLARAYGNYEVLFARANKLSAKSCANRCSSRSKTISTPSCSSSRSFATSSN